ncbi:LamG-like jellyroll fold domain-containing protein [Nocardiopsis sp. YSL2]|uniref:LamG-like jellyroll fold domain-containing protein n=1 Tax=Nocardiopsis sp. YSL2 TaxID=2939492 RepID=UPI0026F476E0|nr:LamG-like jellyroll fold domain-containing protein [Nocardiopsis sp. YSL2]
MRRALTRATAVSSAMALALSLLTAPSALADEEDSSNTDPSSSEEERDALALAEETGERVEIAGLTDEKTQHFANPDGTLTMETHAVPVRVRSEDGWVDADPTLVATDDGLVRPRAAGMDIAFSGGGDAPMAEIGIGSNSVELGWNGELPEPALDGDQATYADVLPDVDLVLTAGVEGFTQVLVVHTPEAAQAPELAELQLALGTEGVTVTEDEHGNLEAVGDQGGQGVFAVQAPAMWDSAGAEEAAESEDPTVAPLSGSRVEQVETAVGVDSIRLLPDQAMLADEATDYPVYIDPSVSANRPNWGYVDKAYPNQEYFNPTVDSVGVGRIEWDRVYTRRAFFQFTTMGRTEHSNTIIHSATLRTEVDWAYDCNSDSHIQLHRVDRFNSNTTWNNQPTTRTKQDEKNVTGGWATCPSSSGVEFDATNAYKWGLDNGEAYIYLRLKEKDESGTTAWRRFDTKDEPPVLVVDYNHPPETPKTSTISDSLGGVCSTDPEQPRLINDTTVTLRAQVRDRDSYWVGQQVKARFEWKAVGETDTLGSSDSAYVTVAKWSSGSYRSATASDLPEQQLIAYRARGHDKTNWGPWSTWCYVEIDTSKPDSGPAISSTDYPAGDEPYGTVGRTGEFTFTNNGVEDASAYHYSVNDASCSTTIDLDTPGAEVTVPITPRREGPNLIHARITDAHGNSSECGLVYTFTVAPPNDPVSYFPVDEGQGTTAADVLEAGRTADATGPVDWTRGRVGERTSASYRLEGTAVDIDGSVSRMATDAPVVDTSSAFSVSAWVRMDDKDRNRSAVAQTGEGNSGFYLGYQQTFDHDRWVLKMAPSDEVGATGWTRALSDEPAETGVWTHLLGTFDPASGETVLYVDGVRQQSTGTMDTPWQAEGPLMIGGGLSSSETSEHWLGGIDDVRVWDRVLTDESLNGDEDTPSEAWTLANRPAALEGRWQLDETGGTAVADSSDHGLDATLHGDPMTAWNQALNDVTFAPGVSLNADHQEHITTDAPAVRTDRSYSVAAWVRLDEVGHNATAVSQDGNDHSAFYLSYQSTYEWNNWVMKLPPSDQTGATGWHRALSDHEPEFGRWTHLAATYDHTKREATLYIDGVAQGTAEVPAAWHASGSTVIGGARFEQAFEGEWDGDISDVHLYQGVLNQADIAHVYEGFLPLN